MTSLTLLSRFPRFGPRLWAPLIAFAATRLGLAVVAYLAEPLMADNAAPPPYHLRPDNVLLDVFGSRWDTGFYLSIAAEGYKFRGEALPSVAFFPLLPLLIRALMPLTGDPLIAGLVAANAALLGASYLLYRLVEAEWGAPTAARSVWYLLLFPSSLFGSAIYSESLLLLCAIGALYAARRGRWGVAASLAFLAGLTRLMGVLVAPLLLIEWWPRFRRREADARPWAGLAALTAPLGTLAYMLYLGATFGDPLAFARASGAWGRAAAWPWAGVAQLAQAPAQGWWAALLAGRLPLDNWIDLLTGLAFLGLGVALLVQRRWSEGAFVALGALLPLSSGLLMSQRRYMWVLFPAFVLLARWGGRAGVDRTIISLFALGLGLMTALFANWYWVG